MDLRDSCAKASIASPVVVVTVSTAMSLATVELPAQGLRHLSFVCVGSAADEDGRKHPRKRRRRRTRVENERLSDEFEDALTHEIDNFTKRLKSCNKRFIIVFYSRL